MALKQTGSTLGICPEFSEFYTKSGILHISLLQEKCYWFVSVISEIVYWGVTTSCLLFIAEGFGQWCLYRFELCTPASCICYSCWSADSGDLMPSEQVCCWSVDSSIGCIFTKFIADLLWGCHDWMYLQQFQLVCYVNSAIGCFWRKFMLVECPILISNLRYQGVLVECQILNSNLRYQGEVH